MSETARMPAVVAVRGDSLRATARSRAAPPPASIAGEPLAFFWSHPEGEVRAAAYGESARVEAATPEELRELLTAVTRADAVRWTGNAAARLPGPFFGAVAFDVRRPLGREWHGFARVRFAAPRILVWWEGDQVNVAAFERLEQSATLPPSLLSGSALARRAREDLARGGDAPPLAGVRALPLNGARGGWDLLVGAALERIARGDLDKVVLARAVEVRGAEALSVPALLAALEARHPSCRTFLLRGDAGTAFVGATPETFCRLEGARLETEALAGSAPPAEAAALASRPKDLREHAWVVEHLVAALHGIAGSIEVAAGPALRLFTDVAHLHTPVRALLRPGAGLADVVLALHPTPAVGGVPAQAALRFIADREALDRGLYAGLVGVCGPGRADLSVALRCALVSGSGARLFVGAGVVAGSTAESEWAETELKTRALLGVLGASA